MIKLVLKIVKKIVVWVFSVVLALVIIVLGGLNLAKFALYSEYYSAKTNICKNPGLSDGFVCQGLGIYDKTGKIFVSGYMKDKTASRVYVTDTDDNSFYVELYKNDSAFLGHAGGIAISNDTVLIASESTVYSINANQILSAQNGDKIELGAGTKVNNAASFIFADDQFVYVGEFHDGANYVTNHPFSTPDGEYFAIMSRYPAENLSAPDKIYSIRNKVQGVCFTDDGRIVLSTSYGLKDSVYYVYNDDDAISSGLVLDGAPVYYLNNCQREVKGPAMAEGMDFFEGKAITLTESASNKYIFGKFFFANHIVGLEF